MVDCLLVVVVIVIYHRLVLCHCWPLLSRHHRHSFALVLSLPLPSLSLSHCRCCRQVNAVDTTLSLSHCHFFAVAKALLLSCHHHPFVVAIRSTLSLSHHCRGVIATVTITITLLLTPSDRCCRCRRVAVVSSPRH